MFSISFVYNKTNQSEYLDDGKGKMLEFNTMQEAQDHIDDIYTYEHEQNGDFVIVEQYGN